MVGNWSLSGVCSVRVLGEGKGRGYLCFLVTEWLRSWMAGGQTFESGCLTEDHLK